MEPSSFGYLPGWRERTTRQLTETCPAAFQSLDNESEKNYLPVVALTYALIIKMQILP